MSQFTAHIKVENGKTNIEFGNRILDMPSGNILSPGQACPVEMLVASLGS